MLLAMLLPALALASGPDTESAGQMAKIQAWQSQISQQLVERGTADSLTAAAIMRPVSLTMYDVKVSKKKRQSASHMDATTRLLLLDRAAAAAPGAPDIAALALQTCTSVPGCDVASHAERLHHAAPDDASYLLPALSDAQSRQDQDTVSAILQSMAESSTFKSWYAAALMRTQRGLGEIVLPASPLATNPGDPDLMEPSLLASTAAVALLAAQGIPSYGILGRACQKDSPEFLDRQEACRQIGILLSHGKSLITANIGLAFWRQSARDKADLAAARKATRKLDWQQNSWSELMLDGTVAPRESFQATLDNHGEIPGMVALLEKHNVPTTPPAGWVSLREKSELAKQESPAAPSSMCEGTP